MCYHSNSEEQNRAVLFVYLLFIQVHLNSSLQVFIISNPCIQIPVTCESCPAPWLPWLQVTKVNWPRPRTGRADKTCGSALVLLLRGEGGREVGEGQVRESVPPVHSTPRTLHCTNLYCANALLHCIFGNHGYSAATKSSPSHSGSKHASAIGCYGDQLVQLRATDLVIISDSESHRQPSQWLLHTPP